MTDDDLRGLEVQGYPPRFVAILRATAVAEREGKFRRLGRGSRVKRSRRGSAPVVWRDGRWVFA